MGGHLHHIETCPAGVVWGIGMDHTVWVYTGGYGGGLFKGKKPCITFYHLFFFI